MTPPMDVPILNIVPRFFIYAALLAWAIIFVELTAQSAAP